MTRWRRWSESSAVVRGRRLFEEDFDFLLATDFLLAFALLERATARPALGLAFRLEAGRDLELFFLAMIYFWASVRLLALGRLVNVSWIVVDAGRSRDEPAVSALPLMKDVLSQGRYTTHKA